MADTLLKPCPFCGRKGREREVMAEYYVIRDKNTGLYFRGKGANRWGKHYNQASIYRIKGQAEHIIKGIAWRGGEQAEIVPIHIIENTADVVEVVRCKECKKRLTSDCSLWYGNLNGNDYFVGVEDDFGCIRGERGMKEGVNNE